MMYWFQHRFSGSSPLQLPPVISPQWATAARPICVRVCVCACVLSVFVCSCMCVFVSAQAIEGGCSPQGSVDGLGAPVDNTDNQDQLFNQWTSSINTRARTTRLHAQTHTHIHTHTRRADTVWVSERWREKQMSHWSWEEASSHRHIESFRQTVCTHTHTRTHSRHGSAERSTEPLNLCVLFDVSSTWEARGQRKHRCADQKFIKNGTTESRPAEFWHTAPKTHMIQKSSFASSQEGASHF